MRLQTKYEMPAPADIVVYGPDRHLVLAVEVKETRQASAKEAAALRRNLLAHELLPDSAFFLLVYPSTMFLWRRETPAAGQPDYVASTSPVLNDTELNIAGDADGHLRKGGLELCVFAWLSVLASNLRGADPRSEPEKMLIDSGVYEQLRHGDVRFEADL